MLKNSLLEIYNLTSEVKEKTPEKDYSYTLSGIKYHQIVLGESYTTVLEKYNEGSPTNIIYTLPSTLIENIFSSILGKISKKVIDSLRSGYLIMIDYMSFPISVKITKDKKTDIKKYIDSLIATEFTNIKDPE